VLKDGRSQGTMVVAETSPDDLVMRMVGRELSRRHTAPSAQLPRQVPMLEVRGLSDRAPAKGRGLLKNVSFAVYPGEVVAFAGLCGAGRTETALSVFGARPGVTVDLRLNGQPIRIRSPRDAVNAGIGYVSEDRKESGLFLEMGMAANMGAAGLGAFGNWWLSDRRLNQTVQDFRRRLGIAATDIDSPIAHLSGGNQQKVLLARWLLVEPKVLFVDEPTRGVDVGAKAEVHALLRALADRGTAVVLISSDLPEVLSEADRVLVMREGQITGELARGEATEENILRLASSGWAA
jgi:ABC-type sugar transport system ATPase subunit